MLSVILSAAKDLLVPSVILSKAKDLLVPSVILNATKCVRRCQCVIPVQAGIQ